MPLDLRTALTAGLVLLSSTLALTGSIAAQELYGTVTQPDGVAPASGVIVVMLAAARDSAIARVVTGERGTYSVKAPRAMTVRLQLLRLGQQPTLAGSFTLADAESREFNLTLTNAPIALAAVSVKANASCAVRPDTSLLVAQLFEEARKALMASSSTVSGVTSVASFTRYTRNDNLKGQLTAPVSRTTVTGPTARPFLSLAPDSLARVGYVAEERDGVTYRAPDAEVLFSDVFLASHCLRLMQRDDRHPRSIGIGFEPVRRDKKLVDIKGTLWLDAATAELENIDFDYDGVAREYTRNGVGGLVEFTHMANGLWFVNKWSIRMPVTAVQQAAGFTSSLSAANNAATEVVLSGTQTIGGTVQSVRMNGEVLYASSDLSFMEGEAARVTTNTTRDVKTASASTNANPRPDSYVAVDSISAVSTCGGALDAKHIGSAQGRVTDDAKRAIANAVVQADWSEDFVVTGGTKFQWRQRSLTTTTSADGAYTICGLPTRRLVTLVATRGTVSSRAGTVRVVEKQPRASLDLTVRTPIVVAANARSAVIRVLDHSGEPIPHALIAVNGSTERVADDDGIATLAISPGDSISVLVRRIGFTPFNGYAKQASKTEPFTVELLPAAQRLATVNVRARERTPLELTGFYNRVRDIQRGAVLGEFFTPEQIDQRQASKASQIFLQSKFVTVEVERGWGNALTGKSDYSGTGQRVFLRGRGGCTMTVLVDGVRMPGMMQDTNAKPGERMGIDDMISVGSIHAIEVYSSGVGTPTGIAPGENNCGVVAIWTSSAR